MKRFAPNPLETPDGTHTFAVRLLASLAVLAAVPVALWIIADPATALLTLTAFAFAGLLLVGVLESTQEESDSNC